MADEIGDNDPIPLSVAAKLFFHGALTKSSLRTEAAKGNLEIIRIANKDFVTPNGIRRMIERCKVKPDPITPTPFVGRSSGQTSKDSLKALLQIKRSERERKGAE